MTFERRRDGSVMVPAPQYHHYPPPPSKATTTTHAAADHPHRRGLIRPIAVKATTIHPRMVQGFYEECEQFGIPTTIIQRAVQESHEWHRKWTLQDEKNHTHPHDRPQCHYHHDTTSHHDNGDWKEQEFQLLDRQQGAKNPSLENSPDDNEYYSSWSSTATGTGDYTTAATRLDTNVVRHANQTPLIRPIALRKMMAPSPLELPMVPPSPSCSPLTLPSPPPPTSSDQHYHYQHHHDMLQDEDDEEDSVNTTSSCSMRMSSFGSESHLSMDAAKDNLLQALAISGGDVDSPSFAKALLPLIRHYDELGWDARGPTGHVQQQQHSRSVEGMWLTLSKPTYFGNLGDNPNGDPMYTLGRMAFDMFLPTQLVCSLQGNFNPVHIVPPEERQATLGKVPKSLLEEVEMGNNILRTYNIVTAFTIEAHLADFPLAPNKTVRRPIKGIMTTYGYVLPDPLVPNRLSIWFTGGKIAPNDDPHDQMEWKRLFANHENLPSRSLGEKARVLAAHLLMGAEVPKEMNEDGSMEFSFTRPLGGHGVAYVDVIYLDDTLRVVRGHRGTIFVFSRLPDHVSFGM